MGILNSSTKISWNEPWFFLIRIRTLQGWLKRIAFAVVVAVIMFAVTYYFGGARFDIVKALAAGGLSGLAILLLLDKPNLQREVTISETDIHIHSAGSNWWSDTFGFDAIDAIELKRSDETSYKYGVMIIDHGDEGFMVAVPNKVSLDTLANVLYRLELAVALSGWEPPEGEGQVLDALEIDPEQTVGLIAAEDLDGVEPRLSGAFEIIVQIVVGPGPLLLGLGGLIWAGVHLFLHWGELDPLNRCLIGAAGLGGVVVGFLYLMRIGQFICNAYVINRARAAMQRRSEPLYGGTEDDLMAVELFNPEKWTKIGLPDDYGFLQIDRMTRVLKLEGSKTRWTMPFFALKSCRIKECVTGGEGANTNAERRYFVVLSAEQEGEVDDWEFGLLYLRTEIGSDTYEKRYERSKLLFTQLADAINP